MDNFDGVELGGRVRLTSKGYVLDDDKQIWVNEGRRLDNGHIVNVYLFNPSLEDKVVEKKIQQIESQQKQSALHVSAQKINKTIFSYAVFETPKSVSEKPANKPERKNTITQSQTPPKPKREGAKVPAWLFASAIGVMVFACIVAGLLGVPTIMAALQPPTPTATVTPTPQIFMFVQDTAVTNFVTGESFVIPKDSKVIIENPTHTECEVLANWNGTQIIIPAKVVFPDRTTCP